MNNSFQNEHIRFHHKVYYHQNKRDRSGGVAIVIENKRIIRFGVPMTYDANLAANSVLDKKELVNFGK